MRWSWADRRLVVFLEWAQTVGVVLLLGLMALALGNDIWRVITGQFG